MAKTGLKFEKLLQIGFISVELGFRIPFRGSILFVVLYGKKRPKKTETLRAKPFL